MPRWHGWPQRSSTGWVVVRGEPVAVVVVAGAIPSCGRGAVGVVSVLWPVGGPGLPACHRVGMRGVSGVDRGSVRAVVWVSRTFLEPLRALWGGTD